MHTSSSRMDIRLRRYVPGGAAGGILPTQSIDWTAPLGDVSTLTFTVSETVAGTIPSVYEFAVEVFDGTQWREPRGGRFMNQNSKSDELDKAGIKDLTCVSFVHWMLAKAELQTADGEDQEFDTTVGGIMRTMIDAAKARGWGPFIGVTFNEKTDSAGNPWNETARLEISFTDGTVLSQALQTLADQGVLEYATDARTLHVFNPGHGSDHSAGAEMLTVGARVQEMPVDVTNEDLLTAITVRGEDKSWTFTVPGGYTTLGRLEGSLEAGGVTKQTQAARFAELLQTTGKAPRAQYTLSESAALMDARPAIDYDLGDWVSARRPTGWERMRVTEVQVHRDEEGTVTADISLADRLTDLAARLAKRSAALGAKLGGNGSLGNKVPSGPGAIGPGDGGAGFPNPKPEYGTGWPAAGPGFEWGSEGSDPNTTPEYADNFIVEKYVETNVYGGVQNEGNLVFALGELPTQFIRTAGIVTGEDGVTEPGLPKSDAWGTVELSCGYLYGGTEYDWQVRQTFELKDELLHRLFKASSAYVKPPHYVDPSYGTTHPYQFAGAGFTLESVPFSTAGWLYLPVRVQIYWEAYHDDGYVVIGQSGVSLRFFRSKITDHRTFGPLELVPKAELDVVDDEMRGRVNVATTRAGNQTLLHVSTGHQTSKLYSATFTDGDIVEERFTAVPHIPTKENVIAFPYTIAKSLDGSGMSILTGFGEELPLAADNIRRREEDTEWTTVERPYGEYPPLRATWAGRSVHGQLVQPQDGTPTFMRVGALTATGEMQWSAPLPISDWGDPYVYTIPLTYSYDNWVYGSGYAIKLSAI